MQLDGPTLTVTDSFQSGWKDEPDIVITEAARRATLAGATDATTGAARYSCHCSGELTAPATVTTKKEESVEDAGGTLHTMADKEIQAVREHSDCPI